MKLYAPSEKNLKNLLHTTEKYSNDIGLHFGLSKCAIASMKKGTTHNINSIDMIEGKINPMQEPYVYLGIPQSTTTDLKSAKEKLQKTYFERLEQLLTSNLSSKNTISAINMFCVPAISYAAPCLDWTEEELKAVDISTRKILNKKGAFHLNSCTLRLYVSRKKGGRGLLNVQNQIRKIISKCKKNIHERQQHDKILSIIHLHTIHEAPVINFLKEHIEKPLHGRFLKETQIKNWKLNLRKDIESFAFALQEQSIPTMYYRRKIEKQNVSPICRLCKAFPETVNHILSSCPVLAKKQYLQRHNSVGSQVYKQLCRSLNLKYPQKTKYSR